MLLLKILIGLVLGWAVICIAGYILFLATGIEAFGYPICWTVMGLWYALTIGGGGK